MGTGTQAVTLTREGAIGIVHLERAHGNAIDDAFVESLVAALAEAESDPAISGILLTAGGKIFCPGLDLQELFPLDREAMERLCRCIARPPAVAAPAASAAARSEAGKRLRRPITLSRIPCAAKESFCMRR